MEKCISVWTVLVNTMAGRFSPCLLFPIRIRSLPVFRTGCMGSEDHRADILAFTLIELLVAIAVLCILASLLLPALNRAKIDSQSTACRNNERQLALAFQLYSDDFEDKLPYNFGS